MTRRVGSLLRFLTLFFQADPSANSTSWTPHTPVTAAAYAAGVFASQWVLPSGGESPFKSAATAYTILGNGTANWVGPTLPVPCDSSGGAYYDLYSGTATPLTPIPSPDGGCALPLALEARAIGAVLALGAADAADPPPTLAPFLALMANMTARPLASFDTAPVYLQQTMTPIAPAPLAAAPRGTVLVTGASGWSFSVVGTEIEGAAGRNNTDAGKDGECVCFAAACECWRSSAPSTLRVSVASYRYLAPRPQSNFLGKCSRTELIRRTPSTCQTCLLT